MNICDGDVEIFHSPTAKHCKKKPKMESTENLPDIIFVIKP